jgi:hypothetical protein
VGQGHGLSLSAKAQHDARRGKPDACARRAGLSIAGNSGARRRLDMFMNFTRLVDRP